METQHQLTSFSGVDSMSVDTEGLGVNIAVVGTRWERSYTRRRMVGTRWEMRSTCLYGLNGFIHRTVAEYLDRTSRAALGQTCKKIYDLLRFHPHFHARTTCLYLNNDLSQNIAKFLDWKSLAQLGKTCSAMKITSGTPKLWESHCRLYWKEDEQFSTKRYVYSNLANIEEEMLWYIYCHNRRGPPPDEPVDHRQEFIRRISLARVYEAEALGIGTTKLVARRRSILVNWLFKVAFAELGLTEATMFRCMHIVDRYCTMVNVCNGTLQLLGASAMMLASKHEDARLYTVRYFKYLCRRVSNYHRRNFIDMEQDILRKLNWNISIHPTAWSFLDLYLTLSGACPVTRDVAAYYLERSLYEHRLQKYHPSKLCAACVIEALRNPRTSLLREGGDDEYLSIPKVVSNETLAYEFRKVVTDNMVFVEDWGDANTQRLNERNGVNVLNANMTSTVLLVNLARETHEVYWIQFRGAT